jgi:hypothetical protein
VPLLTSCQFDQYAARFPSTSTLGGNCHSHVHDSDTHVTYGYSWKLRAIQEQMAANFSKAGTHNKLELYLNADLEKTGDVVAWWGVSIPFLAWNVVLIWHRITQHSTQHSHIWPGTTYQFKARPHLLNTHSQMRLSLTQSSATGWPQTHSRHCKS